MYAQHVQINVCIVVFNVSSKQFNGLNVQWIKCSVFFSCRCGFFGDYCQCIAFLSIIKIFVPFMWIFSVNEPLCNYNHDRQLLMLQILNINNSDFINNQFFL